jgi:hypothetical protein
VPFKSRSQQAFLEIHKPEIAKEFANHTPKSSYKNLPEHAARDKNGLRALTKKYRRSKNGQENL